MVASESSGIGTRHSESSYGNHNHHHNGTNGGHYASNGHNSYYHVNGTNGVNGHKPCNGSSKQTFQMDFDFTSRVIAATGPNAQPRMAQIMPSLLRHLHDFAREVDLTVGEWMAGVDFVRILTWRGTRSGELTWSQINAAGRMSTDSRNETQLICDILGLESLVDAITANQLATSSRATSSAVLGPFYRHGAPIMPNGSSIVAVPKRAEYASATTFLSGRVVDPSGIPIRGAVVDVWHAAPNGMYEQQDPDQPEMNLRGRFQTDEHGRYSLYCLRPVPYPIPFDGPGGQLLQLLDRHPYRPAHIHFIVDAPGHRPLITQLFDREDKYLVDDAVFAVKDDLIVDYAPRAGDMKAKWTLAYDFVLTKDDEEVA